MNTTQLKTTLHSLIDHIEDDSILQAYVVLLSREAKPEADFWDTLDVPTKAAIEEGVQDLNAGRKTDFFQFMKQQYGVER
ncbi:MAG: hypothetical protein LH609_01120 [Rudanella sp.]|nr:hypothetical protein [Rudanella sp.]